MSRGHRLSLLKYYDAHGRSALNPSFALFSNLSGSFAGSTGRRVEHIRVPYGLRIKPRLRLPICPHLLGRLGASFPAEAVPMTRHVPRVRFGSSEPSTNVRTNPMPPRTLSAINSVVYVRRLEFQCQLRVIIKCVANVDRKRTKAGPDLQRLISASAGDIQQRVASQQFAAGSPITCYPEASVSGNPARCWQIYELQTQTNRPKWDRGARTKPFEARYWDR
jgi:hypothetical protein